MRSIKLEDLKKELNGLFEEAIEEVAEEIVRDEEVIADKTATENTEENTASTFDEGAASKITATNVAEKVIEEEIFNENNIEAGESQKIEEADKPTSKFKSVEELEKAYSSLEKEFTKRCQRLAQLEKEMSESRTETPEQWKAKVDKFFVETPSAKAFAREMAEVISSDSSLRARKDCLEAALNKVLMEKYRSPKELATDEEFLREHILSSDFVKKAVIDGYMKDLRDGKPPVLISKAGQNTVAPRNKPKTIADAGRLFQQNNR